MKKHLLLYTSAFIFCFGNFAFGQSWSSVGPDEPLASTSGSYTSSAVIGNALFVAYWRSANYPGTYGTLNIRKFNASANSWETVGQPDLYTGTTQIVRFAYKGNTPYLLYADQFVKLNASGTAWEPVSLDATSLANVRMYGPTNIAFHGDTEYRIEVASDKTTTLQRLNTANGQWENQGSPLFPNYVIAYNLLLVFNGDVPYVAYSSVGAYGVIVTSVINQNVDGTWDIVGKPDLASGATSMNYLSLTFNNGIPYVSLTSPPNRFVSGTPVIKRLNTIANDWETVGETADFMLNSGSGADYLQLAFLNNIPYVAYTDGGFYGSTGRVVVKKLNAAGTHFETLAPPRFTSSNTTDLSLGFLEDKPYVTFTERQSTSFPLPGVKRLNEAGTDWETLGGSGFTALDFAYDFGTTYALYADAASNNQLSVRKLMGNADTWQLVGNAGFSTDIIAGENNISLAVKDNVPYVAYNANNKLRVLRLGDLNTWEIVGNPDFSTGFAAYPVIAFIGNQPYIAFSDESTGKKARVMRLNALNNTWENVGNPGFSTGAATALSLATDGSNLYVGYSDGALSNKASVMKLAANSGTWQPVGLGFSNGTATELSMALNADVPYVAFKDGFLTNKATIMRLNPGTGTWENVGSAGFSSGAISSPSLAMLSGNPYISFQDEGADGLGTARVMRFINNAWENVGAPNFTTYPVTNTKLDFNGSTAYLMYNVVNAYASVRKFASVINPEPMISSFSPQNGGESTAVELTGSNFIGTTQVYFGGVPAKSFTVNSASSITAIVANGNSGAVSVLSSGGAASLEGFNYNSAPIITSFTPNATGTQTQVIITGNYFAGATSVTFGGMAAKSFTVNSGTRITALIENGSSGAISVTTPYGIATAPGFTFVNQPSVVAAGSTVFASGGKVVLTTNEGAGYSYQWLLNGNPITGATTSSLIATQGGDYSVRITIGQYSSTSEPINVNAIFTLPTSNYKIFASSVSCRGQKNGYIEISTAQNLTYQYSVKSSTVNLNGSISTGATTLSQLAAGVYSICFTLVDHPEYKQCFEVTVNEPQDLMVYTAIDKSGKQLNLSLSGGSSYLIELNGASYVTTASSISLPLGDGSNRLRVMTDKFCQGSIERFIDLSGSLAPYPNPFQNILYVNLGDYPVARAQFEIYSLASGQTVFSHQVTNQSGVIALDVSSIQNGMYFLKLTRDRETTSFKIIKQ